MKQIIKISVILFAYLLLCGKSCTDEGDSAIVEENVVETERESIRNEVEVAWLSEESKYTSEVGAAQKLADLADYLGFYTDPSLDSTFRKKAGEMIRDLFIPGEVSLSFPALAAGMNRSFSVQDLLGQDLLQKLLFTEIEFDSIRVLEPLQKSGPEAYLGMLGCTQQAWVYGLTDTLAERSAITVDVVVRRNVKVFGKDTIRVWDVLLGEMKIMNE